MSSNINNEPEKELESLLFQDGDVSPPVGFVDTDLNEKIATANMLYEQDPKAEFVAEAHQAEKQIELARREGEVENGGVDLSTMDRVLDVPKGALNGFINAANESAKLIGSLGVEALSRSLAGISEEDKAALKSQVEESDLIDKPFGETETVPGKAVEGIVQFLGPFAALNRLKWIKAAGKAPKALDAILKAGVVDFVAFDEQMRLADKVAETLGFAEELPKFLKADPNDSIVEKRFNNVVDGALMGAGLGVAVKATQTGMKALQKAKYLKKATDESVEAVTKGPIKKTQKETAAIAKKAEGLAGVDRPKRVRPIQSHDELIDMAKTKYGLDDASIDELALSDDAAMEFIKAMEKSDIDSDIAAATLIQQRRLEKIGAVVRDTNLDDLVRSGDEKAIDTALELGRKIYEFDAVAKDVATPAARGLRARKQKFVEEINVLYGDSDIMLPHNKQRLAEAITTLAKQDGDVSGFIHGLAKWRQSKIGKPVGDFIEAAEKFFQGNLLMGAGVIRDPLSNMVRSLDQVMVRAAAAPIGAIRRKAGKALANKGIKTGFFRNLEDGVTFQETSVYVQGMLGSYSKVFKQMSKMLKDRAKNAALKEGGGVKANIKGFLEDVSAKAGDIALSPTDKLHIDEVGPKYWQSTVLGSLKMTTPFAKALDYVSGMHDKVFGFYRNSDHLMKSMHYQSTAIAEAHSDAVLKGLKGDEYARHVADFGKNVGALRGDALKNFTSNKNLHVARAIFEKTGDDSLLKQIDRARRSSAQAERLALTEDLDVWGQNVEAIFRAIPGGKFIMPFTKTVWNAGKYNVELAGLRPQTWRDLRKGGRTAEMAAGRLSLATMYHTSALYLASQDYDPKNDIFVRSSHQLDKAVRSAFDSMGIKSDSIVVGGVSVSLRGAIETMTFPLRLWSNILAIEKDYIHDLPAEEEHSLMNAVSLGIMATADSFLSSTFAETAMEVVNIIMEGDDYKLNRMGRQIVSVMTSPSIASYTATHLNPIMNQTNSTLDSIKARIKVGKPRYDKYGNVIKASNVSLGFFVPHAYEQVIGHPIATEEFNQKAFINYPDRAISRSGFKAKLTGEEYDRLLEIMGELKTEAKLSAVIESGQYKGLVPGAPSLTSGLRGSGVMTKGQRLREAYNTQVKLAEEKLLLERPEIMDRLINNKIKGITDFSGGVESNIGKAFDEEASARRRESVRVSLEGVN